MFNFDCHSSLYLSACAGVDLMSPTRKGYGDSMLATPQIARHSPPKKTTAFRQGKRNSNWQNTPSEADKQPAFQSFGPHFSCQKASHQTSTFGEGYWSSGIEEWHATLQPVGVLM